MTRVICCQLAPRVGDVDGNLALAEAAISSAVERGADVIVLPEVVTSGYPFVSTDEARDNAVTRDHPLFARWRTKAGGAVLVFGFTELGDDGVVYNTAALTAPGRSTVFYRKTHLWDTELLYFTPGDEPPPVVDTHLGAIGVMVCYDLEFPEMTRAVALRGAQLLTVPTNWPYIERPAGWPAPEVVIAMAAARVNRMAVACCDRGGDDRGTVWNEESTVIAADGWQVATPDADGYVVADLDLTVGVDKHISERNDVHGDRRPDVYR